MLSDKTSRIIVSFVTLRRLIGIFGILLPIICIVGGFFVSHLPAQQSVSFYYYTNMRDFLVGLLFGVAMFLICYKGYAKIDTIVNSACGIACSGIAIFPCIFDDKQKVPIGIFQLDPSLSDTIHFICAALFFTLLAINSLFLFTLSSNTKKTRNKIIRNGIYIGCGIVIVVSLICLSIIHLFIKPEIVIHYKLALLFETIMLVAFGISWLVKGETIFRDIEQKELRETT